MGSASSRFVVGRTPSSAPDPLVRLFQHTQKEADRGRRPRSLRLAAGGTAPLRDFFNELATQETSRSNYFSDLLSGEPCPADPTKSLRPSGNVMSRPFILFDSSLD